ncbi:TPA: ATP-binding protein, partial [Candidatus Bathyarchaeota archaeon]|nr:ATP-binding protein [Candidatus Bathyarchaeota archaeon]
ARPEDIRSYFGVSNPAFGLSIGNLRDYPEVPIQVDGYYGLIMHQLISGMTGYGKSYYAGITIEEYQELDRPVPQIIVDSHGEYLTMREANAKHPRGKGYHVREFGAEDFPPAPEVMGADELAKRMGVRGAAAEVLTAAIMRVQLESTKEHFETPTDFLERVRSKLPDLSSGRTKGTMAKAEVALVAYMERFEGASSAVKEAVRQDQISVLNLRKESLEGMQSAVANAVNQLYSHIVRGEIPPCRVVIDEAALYCPDKQFGVGDYRTSLDAIQRAITQGRKFGLGFTIITLRPTLIAATVRGMCATAATFRLTGLDAKEISEMYGFPELMPILPKLKIGEAMVMGIGAPLDRPVPVEIRERFSKHGGVGISLEETLLPREKLGYR